LQDAEPRLQEGEVPSGYVRRSGALDHRRHYCGQTSSGSLRWPRRRTDARPRLGPRPERRAHV